MKLLVRKWYLPAAAATLAAILIGLYLFLQEDEPQEDVFADITDAFAVEEQEGGEIIETSVEETVKKVDVKGAVSIPGLYVASEGERVYDLIEKAGGFIAEADRNQVNLAQIVEDEMVIYVPMIGEELANIPSYSVIGSSAGNNQESQKVSLNTASEAELQTLTGIGPSKAAAIIQYRTDKGPFKSIEELKNVGGIGEKTFEKLKEDITI